MACSTGTVAREDRGLGCRCVSLGPISGTIRCLMIRKSPHHGKRIALFLLSKAPFSDKGFGTVTALSQPLNPQNTRNSPGVDSGFQVSILNHEYLLSFPLEIPQSGLSMTTTYAYLYGKLIANWT